MSASSIEQKRGPVFRPATDIDSGEPGLYLGVPFEQYLKIKAVSNSTLKSVEVAAGLAIWSRDAPIDEGAESAAELGTLVHTLALEKDDFQNRYLVMPSLNLNTKAGREKAEEYEASANAAGLIPVSQADFRKATMMVASLLAYPDIKSLLSADAGHSEVTVLWIDQDTGLKCKARVDRLVLVPDGCIALDLKTIDKMKNLRWAVRDLGYDRQDIHYTEGLLAVGFQNVWFRFGFVASTRELKRYPVRYGALPPELRTYASEAQRARLSKYKQCIEFNEFSEQEGEYLI
jgi:hypothetical protein